MYYKSDQMLCSSNYSSHPITSRPLLTPVQLNLVDAIQGDVALSILESIALQARLDELRNTPQPPPEREAVREAQEQQRPLPERDRPRPSEPRDDYQYAYDGRIERLASAAIPVN